MKPDEYKYLADTLTGRRARDPQFEEQMSTLPEGSINQKAVERQRQLDSKTPEQRELEQRKFSLNTYGREHMLRFANPIVSDKPLGALQIPGDQIKDYRIHSSDRDNLGNQKDLKGHSRETPEPWQNPDGSLRLQNHGACPQRQVLQIIRA
jgi:hypothetical protein